MTQDQALTIMKSGANVFLTGSAGSGKTYILNKYLDYLHERGVAVAMTASTGIAATHIGGMTIHSWSGMGIRDYMDPYTLEAMTEKQYLHRRYSKTKVLVIDEVSMLDAKRLDLVDLLCRTFNRSDAPFGGMQVIVVGDFFQLPPIDRDGSAQFAYQAGVWHAANFHTCYLHEQHRQRDGDFYNVLNAIRERSINDEVRRILWSRLDRNPDELTLPTRLFSHNRNVDNLNDRELAKLPGIEHCFTMQSAGAAKLVEGLKKSCLAPETLCLKEQSLVMFVKNNYDQGYVNGTLGTVIGFDDEGAPIVETHDGETIIPEPESWRIEENGRIRAEISQLPLRLAWAITIHKSQGMSLDAAEIDLSQAFVPGQGYVALSRLRSLEGLFLQGINDMALAVHPEVATVDSKFKSHSDELAGDISARSADELRELHHDFLRRVGGSISAQKNKKERGRAPAKVATHLITKDLLSAGKSVTEVATERSLTTGTILTHIIKIASTDPSFDIDHLRPDGVEEIMAALSQFPDEGLKVVYQHLDERYPYDDIKLAQAFLAREQN